MEAVSAILATSDNRDMMQVISQPTGTGKTRTGAALADHFLRRGYSVLWVTKSWPLLQQAAEELAHLYPQRRRLQQRIGGGGQALHHLPEGAAPGVYYTTLQTWDRRRDQLPGPVRSSRKVLVIYDECHWGLNSRIGRVFLRRYLGRALVVGLSATPRAHAGGKVLIAHAQSAAELYGRRLARPLVREVATGAVWDPTLRDHEFSASSLRTLGRNHDRNEAILKELLEGRRAGRYRHVVVFACNIGHAEALNQMFCRRGVPSRVVHSRLTAEARAGAVRDFRAGPVGVLVNVSVLAEGFNAPDVDAVFLARPTTSRVLCTQMVGRGSRLAPGKDHFWVVEFTDTLRRFGSEVFHARDLIDSCPTPRGGLSRAARPVRHDEPRETPRFEEFQAPGLGTISFVRDQTFGVEIELTAPGEVPPLARAWHSAARKILDRVREAAGAGDLVEAVPGSAREDLTRWRVVRDESAGWEVVSPILVNAEGLAELSRVCAALTDLVASRPDLHVNHRTGMHLTLGTRLNTTRRLRAFLTRLQRLEPGLFTLVSPSRLFRFLEGRYCLGQRNRYCLPVREMDPDIERVRLPGFTAARSHRFRSVNVTHAYEDVQKLEVRMHNGTTEFRKIAPWVSLWMSIFSHARYAWSGPGAAGPVFPGGNRYLKPPDADREDLFVLLDREGIRLGDDLENLLRTRRQELREAWRAVLPRRVKSWERAGWYAD
jgi:superfamily II DNA or RNA helicase